MVGSAISSHLNRLFVAFLLIVGKISAAHAFSALRHASAKITQSKPDAIAFHVANNRHRHQSFMSSDVSSESEADSNSSNKVTITFYSEIAIKSEPAPQPPQDSKKSLQDFFNLPETPFLLLRGSKNNEIVEIPNPDHELLEAYKRQCKKVNASDPTPNDRIFDVTTSGVKFPGLQIMSLATIGGKLISIQNDATGKLMPCFEFVLIQDSTYATGSRFLVWLFNKVTGKSSGDVSASDKAEEGTQTTTSLNRVRAFPMKDDKVAFECNASLGVQMQFPALLMKMIPDGKEKSEKSGSDSLRKALEEDVPPALAGFRDAYMQWLGA